MLRFDINLSLTAHATTGPDGRQYGASTFVRINFESRKSHEAKQVGDSQQEKSGRPSRKARLVTFR
jgi:hypothetical protein